MGHHQSLEQKPPFLELLTLPRSSRVWGLGNQDIGMQGLRFRGLALKVWDYPMGWSLCLGTKVRVLRLKANGLRLTLLGSRFRVRYETSYQSPRSYPASFKALSYAHPKYPHPEGIQRC